VNTHPALPAWPLNSQLSFPGIPETQKDDLFAFTNSLIISLLDKIDVVAVSFPRVLNRIKSILESEKITQRYYPRSIAAGMIWNMELPRVPLRKWISAGSL